MPNFGSGFCVAGLELVPYSSRAGLRIFFARDLFASLPHQRDSPSPRRRRSPLRLRPLAAGTRPWLPPGGGLARAAPGCRVAGRRGVELGAARCRSRRIYGRPVVFANLVLYLVSALSLLRGLLGGGVPPVLWLLLVPLAILAVSYGVLPVARPIRPAAAPRQLIGSALGRLVRSARKQGRL